MKTNPILIRQILPGAMLLAIIACGCRTSEPGHTLNPKIHAWPDAIVRQEQLRLKMRSMVDPLCGVIVAAADGILNSTTNHAVQREALLWKIQAVPEMRKALFQPDPYTALADTWAFSCQMREYFEHGPGKEQLAGAHQQAADACQQIESELEQLAATLTKSGDVIRARKSVEKWVAAHPIQNSIAARESTVSRATEQDIIETFSPIEAVANVTAMVDDINRRVEVYSDQLFQQARWEAELFKLDLLDEMPLDQALPLAERAVKSAEQAVAAVDRLAPDVDRAVAVAEDAPKIIAAEREATLMELHAMLAEERKALTADIEQTGNRMVDHAFWRATELLVCLLIVSAIAVAVVFIFIKRSRIKTS